MSDLDCLPRHYQLALAYAPAKTRAAFETLFLFDAQFARFVNEANEPILAQMRLAWWRERFAQAPEDWPKGNPLLEQLGDWGPHAARLGALVDGWESLLSDEVPEERAVEAFCRGRGEAWLALAQAVDTEPDPVALARAAKRMALVDLAFRSPAGLPLLRAVERSDAARLRRRALKPFTVLDALARRAAAQSRPPLSKPGDMLAALRAGLFGA